MSGFVFDEIVHTRAEGLHRATIFSPGVALPYQKTIQLIKNCQAMLVSGVHSARDKNSNQEDLGFAIWGTVVMRDIQKSYHEC